MMPPAQELREMLWLRGQIHEGVNQTALALSDYDASLQQRGFVDAYLRRARLLARQGDLDRARTGLREGILRMEGAVLLRSELIALCRQAGAIDCALEQVDAILAQARVQTRWLLVRAELLDADERPEEASRDRREALRQANDRVEHRGAAMALERTALERTAVITQTQLLPIQLLSMTLSKSQQRMCRKMLLLITQWLMQLLITR